MERNLPFVRVPKLNVVNLFKATGAREFGDADNLRSDGFERLCQVSPNLRYHP